jgi:hypothetical protein
VWAQFRARPQTLLAVCTVALALSLTFTTLMFAGSLVIGTVGSLFVLGSLAAVYDAAAAVARARARRRGTIVADLRGRPADGGLA